MDESHRLKEMPAEYDRALFNSIYKETLQLRKKLAFEIDGRKFGVDYKEILSWFDVKMLYAFRKYHEDPRCKGYVINALRTYKQRLILNSYQEQYHLHNTVDITEVWEDLDKDLSIDDSQSTKLLESAKSYLKQNLSEDAFFILEIELNPPPYIINNLKNAEQKKMPKLSTEVIADYLDISDDEGFEYIDSLRQEIKEITFKAKEYFSLNPKIFL